MNGTVGGHPLYSRWAGIKQRCYNPNTSNYRWYGGRGIKMCDRWRDSFWAFVEDVGLPPSSEHTLDRINGDGDYEPGNVRWANLKEQANNRPDFKAKLNTKAAKANRSRASKQTWEVHGDRMAEAIRAARTTPEARQQTSEIAKAIWADPERRAKASETAKARQTKKVRRAKSAILKERWADPVEREKLLANRKTQPPCTAIENGKPCGGTPLAKGLCRKHYLRLYRQKTADA